MCGNPPYSTRQPLPNDRHPRSQLTQRREHEQEHGGVYDKRSERHGDDVSQKEIEGHIAEVVHHQRQHEELSGERNAHKRDEFADERAVSMAHVEAVVAKQHMAYHDAHHCQERHLKADVPQHRRTRQEHHTCGKGETVRREIVAPQIGHGGVDAEHRRRPHYARRHAHHQGEGPDEEKRNEESAHRVATAPEQQRNHGVDDAEMESGEGKHMRHTSLRIRIA